MIIENPEIFRYWLATVLEPLKTGCYQSRFYVETEESVYVLRVTKSSTLTLDFVFMKYDGEKGTNNYEEDRPIVYGIQYVDGVSRLAVLVNQYGREVVASSLCDADPAALAKYIYALVKKDKPVNDLRESMVDQLDVFLQQETKSFVALLFKTIESKEYLNVKKEALKEDKNADDGKSGVQVQQASEPDKEKEKDKGDEKDREKEKEKEKENEDFISSTDEKQNGIQIQSSVVSEGTVKTMDNDNKFVDGKDGRRKEHDRDGKFRLNRSRTRKENSIPRNQRSRSRSRSWDRLRRSRSRDRDRDRSDRMRERDKTRLYRNKSPPSRYDRGFDRRSKSRSPKPSHRGRFRNRSPPLSRSRSPRSRSRSRSRSYVRDETPTHHGDVDMRSHAPHSVNDNECDRQRGSGNRCRDYDEQGYCMRGELCPYDHGTDPVVMEDLALTQVLMFGPQGPPNMPLAPPGVPRPLLEDFVPAVVPGMPPPPGVGPLPNALPPMTMMMHGPPPLIMRPPTNMEYSPDAPGINPSMNWGRPAFRGPPRPVHPHQPGMGFNQGHRALISVPNHGHSEPRKPGFDSNRQFTNCCLVLKKVPPGLNNITHLNNHFAKFGKIVNIQVNYENDPESAMVTFSSPAEANAAIKSTEAVLNNRFIKVFWHNSNKDGTKQNNNYVKDRLGTTPQSSAPTTTTNTTTTSITSTSGDNTTSLSSTAVVEKQAAADLTKKETSSLLEDKKAKTMAAIRKSQEILEKNKLLRKKTEEKRKEALKLTSDLRKRRQNLLEKQIQQQKELIKKLELGNLEEKQKKKIMETIKVLQDSIEKIKKELLAASKSPRKVVPVKKTKEEIQKEILDTELDLISKQQEGGDVSALMKKITTLKLELTKLQPKAPGPRYLPHKATPHKSSIVKNMSINRTLTNKVNRFKAAVDHRPTKILVSGYENDEKDLVLSHFRQFGEIGDYIADDSTPSIVLNFKTRQEAENAMAKGKSFQDRLLTVTWFTNTNVQTRRRNSSASGPTYHMHAGRQVLLSGSETDLEQDNALENDEGSEVDHGMESSEDFLLQDDDEDFEDEERSWRR